MEITSIALAVLLGIGLSASTGLNTFLPLLLFAAAARFHIAGISLGEKFDWLTSDVAMIVLIIACVFEIVADKVPAVDHFLDSIGTFIRPAAASLAAGAALTGANVDPVVAAVGGIIIGTPISLGFHTLKAATRVGSSATTFGCANPVLSVIEDIIAFTMTILAIFAPVIVPVVVVLMAWVLWRVVKKIRGVPPQVGQASSLP